MECRLHLDNFAWPSLRRSLFFWKKNVGEIFGLFIEEFIFVFLLESRFAMKFPTPLDDLATWRFFCLVGDPGSLLLEHPAPANKLFTEHPWHNSKVIENGAQEELIGTLSVRVKWLPQACHTREEIEDREGWEWVVSLFEKLQDASREAETIKHCGIHLKLCTTCWRLRHWHVSIIHPSLGHCSKIDPPGW